MTGDATELSSWKPGVGAEWVEVEAGYRPTRIEAEFWAGELWVTVTATGDEHGVAITSFTAHREDGYEGDLPSRDELMAMSRQDRSDTFKWVKLEGATPIRNEDLARIDFDGAARQLEQAAVIGYHRDVDGRPTKIRLGAGPWLAVEDVRRWLAGPEGTTKPGPKAKASPEQVAKVVKTAARKGSAPATEVAEAFDVSTATAHRYIASARRAGLITKEKS